MRHLTRRARSLAVIGAASVALAACGGAQQQSAQETTEPTASEPTAPSPHSSETHAGEASGGDPFSLLKQASDHVGPGGSSQAVASGVVQAAGMEGDVESPAAQLHAQLSSLLQEHVYLAGIAVDIGLSMGLDSPAFQAAADTLDRNSVELADLVGSVAGEEKRDAFLELWRQHIGFFVEYTKGNEEQALQDLDQYRQQAGAFFEDVTGGAVPASAVAEELKGHIQTLTSAIDAAQDGDASVFAKLKQASDHVDAGGSSSALAKGIAEAAGLEGDVDSPAATTYAELANLLEEHVYLAGIAVKTGLAQGLDSGAFQAAADTLDTNAVELADLVGSVAGEEKRDAFLELWRQHIGFFVEYTKGNEEQALQDLDQYRQQAGAFFEDITGGALEADAVASSLEGHVQTVTAAIDALKQVLTS